MVGICNKTRGPPRGAKKQEANKSNHSCHIFMCPFFSFLFSAIAHGPVRCYPYPRSPYPRVAQQKTKPHYGGSCEVTLPPFFQAPHLAQRNLNPLLLSSTTIHYAKNKIKSHHSKEMLPFLSVSVSLLSLLSYSSSPTLNPSHSHTETRISGWFAITRSNLAVVVAPSVWRSYGLGLAVVFLLLRLSLPLAQPTCTA